MNKFGKHIWAHSICNWSAEKSYEWVDRLIIINEDNNREVIGDVKYSTFDFQGWVEQRD